MLIKNLERIRQVALGLASYLEPWKSRKMEKENRNSELLMDVLNAHPRVKICNVKNVERKLASLISGGIDFLQVFSDFDFTISRLWLEDGSRGPSSHGVIEVALPTEFAVKAKNIFDTYYPVEIDPNLTIEQKIPSMIEWWTATHETMIDSGLTKTALIAVCQKSGIVVRDGFRAFSQTLLDDKVPLLIFSAGIADVLEGVLDSLGLSAPNQKIIGNRMKFADDAEGRLVAFQEPLIHVFNKNEALKLHLDYFERTAGRRNSILMGDSLGDLKMVEGVSTVANCLTIGFLNTKVDEMMEKYMESYDIVLIDDKTMDIPNKILDFVKSG